MGFFLAIEARQPNGTVIRVLAGWNFYPLASWITAFARLF
jgi:hypothetical protein